jgi:hypothetical protein
MRKRAHNVVIGLGLAAAGLILGLLALEPDGLAMHLAAWRARVGGGVVVWPQPGSVRGGVVDISAGDIAVLDFLQFIADSSSDLIVLEAAERRCLQAEITIAADMFGADSKTILAILHTNGIDLVQGQPGCIWSLRTAQRSLGHPDEPSDGVLIRVGE